MMAAAEAIDLSTAATLQKARSPKTTRLISIDFLRGGAALAVVLHHAINWNETTPRSLWFRAIHTVLDQGYLGVPLFFVVSGFCIHLRWAKRYAEAGQQKPDWADFWKRRIRRLYPPYFVMLCISMGLVLIAYTLGKEVPLVSIYPEPRSRWMIIDFFAHAGMLHGLHPILDKAGGNPPFWTLAREEYFYLMYLGLLLSRRFWGLGLSVAMVIGTGLIFPILMSLVLSTDSRWWPIVTSSALVLWVQWCLGMVAVEAHYGLVSLPRWCRSLWLIPIWAAAAKMSDAYFSLLSPLMWGMTFFTLLNACLEGERKERWRNQAIVKWLAGVGVFSYSLYLVHNPVRAVMKQALAPLGGADKEPVYLLFAAVMVISGYFAAKLLFALVERRFLNSPATPRSSISRAGQENAVLSGS